jgi:hypothetical protein
MTQNSTYFADTDASRELYDELKRRIQGEQIDLDGATVIIGSDIDTGYEARLTLAGTTAWAEILDNGAL